MMSTARVYWEVIVLGLGVTLCLAGCQASGSSDLNRESSKSDLDPSKTRVKLSHLLSRAQLPAAGSQQDQTSSRAQKRIDQATDLSQDERFIEAMQQLEKALRFSPNSLQAHQLMGETALAVGNYARARDHLQRALQIAPRSALLHGLIGRVYAQQDEWQSALDAYRVALICPDLESHGKLQATLHYDLAVALSQLGYIQASVDSLKLFLEVAGYSAHTSVQALVLPAYLMLSEQYEHLSKPLDAARALQHGLTLDTNPDVHLERLAQLYVKARHIAEAINVAKSLALQQESEGLQLLADIHHQNQRSARALLEDLRELAAQRPNSYPIVDALVDALVSRQDTDGAIAALSDYLNRVPEQPAAATRLSQLFAQQQRWQESIATLSSALSASLDDAHVVDAWLAQLQENDQKHQVYEHVKSLLTQAKVTAGMCYVIGRLAEDVRDHDAAMRSYERALSTQSSFMPAVYSLGQLSLRRFEWQRAIEQAQRLLGEFADDYRPHRMLGQAHMGLDDYEQAAQALNQAIQLNQSDIVTMEALAELYERSGKRLQAKRQYQMIVDTDPTNLSALEMLFMWAVNDQRADLIEEHLEAMKVVAQDHPTTLRCQAWLKALHSRKFDDFAAELAAISEQHPDDIDTLIHLARHFESAGDPQRMSEPLEAALALDPDHTPAIRLQSRLDLYNLRYETVIERVRKLLSIHPNRIPWQLGLLDALIADQQYEAAARQAEDFLKRPNIEDDAKQLMYYDMLTCLALTNQHDNLVDLALGWAENDEDTRRRAMVLDLCRLTNNVIRGVELAEDWYAKATAKQQPDVRRLLLSAYLDAKRYDDAVVVVLDWLEMDPDAFEPTITLIDVYDKADRYSDAIELARATALTQPRQFDAVLAALYVSADEHDQAIRVLREGLSEIKIQGDDISASMGLIDSYRDRLVSTLISAERYTEAEKELTTWLEQARAPTQQRFILQMQALCFQMNDKEALAIQQQEKLLAMNPSDVGLNNDLGYTLADRDMHLDRAEAMIRKAVGSNHRLAAYLDSLGWVLYKKGDFEGAHHWLQRAGRAPMSAWQDWLGSSDHRTGLDDAVVCDHLADASWRIGRQEQAIELWRQAVELAKESDDQFQRRLMAEIQEQTTLKIEAAEAGNAPPLAKSSVDS